MLTHENLCVWNRQLLFADSYFLLFNEIIRGFSVKNKCERSEMQMSKWDEMGEGARKRDTARTRTGQIGNDQNWKECKTLEFMLLPCFTHIRKISYLLYVVLYIQCAFSCVCYFAATTHSTTYLQITQNTYGNFVLCPFIVHPQLNKYANLKLTNK